MRIRSYTGRDFDTVLTLWNRALPHDPVTREQLIRKLLMDPGFTEEGFLLCEDGGEIIGFVNAVCRVLPAIPGQDDADTGFLTAIAVTPGRDEHAVGGILLEAAEKYLSGKGKSRVTTAYPPQYFTQGVEKDAHPGLVRAFLDRGYEAVPSAAKELDLTAYTEHPSVADRRARLAAAGIEVMPLCDEYVSAILDPAAGFSRPSWSVEFRSRLQVNMDFDSMRIAVQHRPDGDRVVGACIFGDPYSDECRFGPFGVSDEMQGMGIGSVLLAEVLGEMKRRGLARAWMQWTSESGPAHTVYSRAGFRVVKRYLTFTKRR